MNEHVTAGAALQEKLAAANGHAVELCDEAGKVVGYALTPEQVRRFEVEMEKALVSKEELDRRTAHPAAYTMEDVLRLVEPQ